MWFHKQHDTLTQLSIQKYTLTVKLVQMLPGK